MNWAIVTNEISAAIEATLTSQRNEEYYPSNDPDRMDDRIANCKRRVEMLRKLRNDFEDEMSKPL